MNPDPTNPQQSIHKGPDGDLSADHDEWALQADAARIAGCSVSAIRKWRREGVIDDRRTTTTGGLDRVEVRLGDVLDRVGREPTRHVATDEVRGTAAAQPGTVIIPLSDLQALILSVGEAERRAREAASQTTVVDTGTQQLTASLARAEAELIAARSEVERHRRRVRELEGASASGSHRAGASLENERLREQVMKLEARMAESRSEVDGQRRRIRELEARQATPSQETVAAKAENDRLRQKQSALEHRLTSAHDEVEGHRRRLRDLEARAATPSDSEIATDAENERLYKQMARLEARLAESGNEVAALRRRLRDMESSPAGPSENEPALEADDASLPEQVRTSDARLSAARSELVAPSPATEPELEPTAERLRVLYHRLHGRPKRDTPTPDEQRQWIADLVAYDKALVVACIDFGVPTSFEPGHRLPAAVRVELTRALRDVGLDVAS